MCLKVIGSLNCLKTSFLIVNYLTTLSNKNCKLIFWTNHKRGNCNLLIVVQIKQSKEYLLNLFPLRFVSAFENLGSKRAEESPGI